MRKVLHYVGRMNRGGMETLIMNLYRNIDQNKVQFDFAVHTKEKSDFDEEIIDAGGKLYTFPSYRKNPFAYRRAWRDFFRCHKNEYTAFHFHTNSLANIVALEEAARAGVPIRIVHSHSSFANKGRLQKINNFLHMRHRRKLKLLATNLYACSQKAAEWLYGGMCLDGINVEVINNGVDCEAFCFCSESYEEKCKELVIENKIVVGHIGKFIEVKNHSFLIDIVAEMVKSDNRIICLLIGDGKLFDKKKKQCEAYGISDHVKFLGVRSDISELLMCMDLFIMPSLYEGLPVSMIEVQASGVPALISDTISSEVKINSNVEFCSLTNTAKEWADTAFMMIKKGRIYDNSAITNAGYDIKVTARKYLELIGGEPID